jgi:uncharacterized paraquat-inducible protein A
VKKEQTSRATAAGFAGLVFSVIVIGMVVGLEAAWPTSDAPLFAAVWLLSFLASAVVAWFVWPMLMPDSGSKYAHPDLHSEVVCVQCGGMLYEEWRLCPHCGARLTREPAASAAPSEVIHR